MDGVGGLSGWRWIFIWEGIFTIIIALLGWCFMVDFPEDAQRNWKFLKPEELDIVISRVEHDRSDAHVTPFHLKSYLKEGKDWKLWFFALNFLASSVVTYSVQYFLPIILQSGLGFSRTLSLCLTAPVSKSRGSLTVFPVYLLLTPTRSTFLLESSRTWNAGYQTISASAATSSSLTE